MAVVSVAWKAVEWVGWLVSEQVVEWVELMACKVGLKLVD